LKIKKTGNVRIKVTLKRVRVTTVAVKKYSVSHIPSECFIALVIQHAKRMRRVMLSVACPAILIFSLYIKNGTIFGKGEVIIFTINFV
jgi:hypothetical protein